MIAFTYVHQSSRRPSVISKGYIYIKPRTHTLQLHHSYGLKQYQKPEGILGCDAVQFGSQTAINQPTQCDIA